MIPFTPEKGILVVTIWQSVMIGMADSATSADFRFRSDCCSARFSARDSMTARPGSILGSAQLEAWLTGARGLHLGHLDSARHGWRLHGSWLLGVRLISVLGSDSTWGSVSLLGN